MSFQDAARCQRVKPDGTQCQGPAMVGRSWCRNHGGKTPKGITNPAYGKVSPHTGTLPGATSKFIPTRLAADYKRAQNDPERLSLLHEISTWAAREQQLLKRLRGHDPGTAWGQVDTAWQSLEAAKEALDTAQAAKDLPAMRQAYHQFQSALTQGRTSIAHARQDYGLWREIKDVHTMLMHLRTQEHKRLLELQRFWSSEQVAMRWGQFLHSLWEACNAILPKEQIRPLLTDFQWRIRRIDAEFTDLTKRQDAPQATITLDLDEDTPPGENAAPAGC